MLASLAFLLSSITGQHVPAQDLQTADPCDPQLCQASCPQGSYFSAGLCAECSVGHYCPGKQSAPRKCPTGTYNFFTGRSSAADCQPCPTGSISTEDRASCKPCPGGVSCNYEQGTIIPCAPGQYSPEGHSKCLPCSPGFICADGQQHTCGPGEEPNARQIECNKCPIGYYSPVGRHCLVCPTGSFCPHTGTSQALPCPQGRYTDQPGQQQCLHCNTTFPCAGIVAPSWNRNAAHLMQRAWPVASCPPGTYRNEGEGPSCLFCSPGHYCVGGVAIPCPAGTYGAKAGLQRQRDCSVCPAGFYCLEGSSVRPSSQFMCPQGFYCEEGTGVPHGTPCPAGTAGGQPGQTSKVACRRCAEGRYCPTGSVFPGLSCARGKFCPAGTLEEVRCPKGTFTPHQGAASVKDCLKCPAGFYCPEGTSDPVPCQPGTFNSLEGQDEPTDCWECQAGKACTQAALKAPDVDCMPGFACPPGASRPNAPANACPPGTTSERTDLSDRSECQQCPARHACPRGTGGSQRPPLICFAGHYCPPGTMFPTQHKCPAGTWSPHSGLEAESECQSCPQGWYCQAGVWVPTGRCSSGHYCPQGTQFGTQFPCPAGSYSTKSGNSGKEDCLPCPEGAYCPEGSPKPMPCPPTTFRKQKGGLRSEDCNACPAGYYCPHSATVTPRACGTGSYSSEGSAACSPCLRGHYCSEDTTSREAMLSKMVCPAGLLCSQGLGREPLRAATLCPRGFYCPGGSINPNPIPCPNGTYGGWSGLREVEECTKCPASHFCFSLEPEGQPIVEPTASCPDGYSCPIGTGNPRSWPCLAGFFRNNSRGHTGEVCVPCPTGYYCVGQATHTPNICPAGYYCPEGASSPKPCEEGTYSTKLGLQNVLECAPCGGGRYCSGMGKTEPSGVCQEGFYCRGRARSATPANGLGGGVCPTGSFCPKGSSLPSPCPPGTFSNITGLTSIWQCIACPAGYYCSGSNSTAPTGPCSPGYYCRAGSTSPMQHEAGEGQYAPAGSTRPQPCPLGTFQPDRARGSCLECQRGRLCNQTGLVTPSLCPPGYYCPAGAVQPHPCPPGWYLAQAGGESLQHCGLCDAGTFCRNPGLRAPQGPCSSGFYCLGGASTATPVNSSTGDLCPVGYFCPVGTRHPRENPCPPGTWSNAVGARDVSSCWLCPAGFFCNGTGLIQPSGLCAPGFYCSGGAKSSSPVDGVTGNRCPAGHHCPLGSATPLSCKDGTHSNTTGATDCLECPPGKYCPSGQGALPCPLGYYCPGGCGVDDPLPCPPGTYSPKVGQSLLEQCLLCPAGTYCEDWALAEPSGPCQAGYFCLAGINFRNPDGNISTGLGGPCPHGHFCPAGTSIPKSCPRGRMSESLYQKEMSGCGPCTPGHFCASEGLSHPTGLCREGFYCPGENASPTGAGECLAAHYCPKGAAAPVPCPAGTYVNLTGQALCSRCPAGYFCPERTSTFTHFPCRPGFYCPDGTKYATQFPCPRGYYNPEPLTQSLDSCLPCPPGHYCEKEHLTTVSGKCKAGWFCVSAAWTAQPFDLDNYTNANCLCPATSTGGKCQEGYFCPTGSSEPLPCPPGTFCNASGLSLPSGPCSQGYYCTGAASSPKPTDQRTGNLCPAGTYCGDASAEPEPCPAGTFSAVLGLTSLSLCQPCTTGFYCKSAGLVEPTASCAAGYWCPPGQKDELAEPCPVSHYCPQGSAAPLPCLLGFYQDKEKQAACKLCEPGYYCPGGNTSVLLPCPKGHYCPIGTAFPHQYRCPAGTFNPHEGINSMNSCLLCPPGKFCSAVGLIEPEGECHAGFWCQKAAIIPTPLDALSGSLCPTGHYCPKGTASPSPCPSGTWSNTTGQKSSNECLDCPGGFYCESSGLSAPSGLCSRGFYCHVGAMSSTPIDGIHGGPCPERYYCPEGSSLPILCEPGTYIPVSQAFQCWQCPPGKYCTSGIALLCPAGFYCPEGTGYDWKACPEGSYSPEPGLAVVSQCRDCDPGHYCSNMNATTTSGVCATGYYCTRGNTSPQPLLPTSGEGGLCPPGHYCPMGAPYPQPCPKGTLSYLRGQSLQEDCVPCPPGHYCSTVGLTAPTGECWEGFYCQQGAILPNSLVRNNKGGPCPAGYFCPRASASPQLCRPGFMSTEEGQASCSPCAPGYYCPINSSSFECPPGYYCPMGTAYDYQYPCPPGTYNPQMKMSRSEDCLPCPAGFYCSTKGLSRPSGTCLAGYFCPSGSLSASQENICPPGHYCPMGSAFAQQCPPGSFSNTSGNKEATACHPCSAGFACTSSGLSAPSQPCQAGYYCPPGQNSSNPFSHPCSPGYMCSAGSVIQTPCEPGSYQNRSAQDECLLCPKGFFCPSTDVEGTSNPIPCPKGHYCPSGSKSGIAFPCPVGTFSSRESLSSAEECVPCPAGKYCSTAGLAMPSGDCMAGYICIQAAVSPQSTGGDTGSVCPSGFFCPAGTSHMLPCPPGTFNPTEGGVSAAACVPCLPGWYCAGFGLESPSGLCSPGYYCYAGASSPAPYHNDTARRYDTLICFEHISSDWDLPKADICPQGHYCPSGSSHPRPCPPGTFMSQCGAKSERDCLPCTPGFYCPMWGQVMVELSCPEGWYCPEGTGSQHSTGIQCQPGHACPRGSAEPSICSLGTYQPVVGQPTCWFCPSGFYCPKGSTAPLGCPVGHVGTAEGLQSAKECSLCPAGTYCNSTGLSLPSGPCAEGHYCTLGATDPKPISQDFGDLCPPGHYCPKGSSSPVPCPAGTFLPHAGVSKMSDCSPCSPGQFCPVPGTSAPAGHCSPGHYCTGAAVTPTPRAATLERRCFCDSAEDLCKFLPNMTTGNIRENWFLFPQNITDVRCVGFQGDLCPPGYYCPEGSSLPRPCQLGQYCDQNGLTSPAGLCMEGYYCPLGSIDPHHSRCPEGHYCPLGTSLPLPCPLGTVKGSTGGSSSDDCLQCPAGHYCEQMGITLPSGLCAPGYYCPGGQQSPTPSQHMCNAGQFCQQGSFQQMLCPPGTYQNKKAQEKCNTCPTGHFCQEEGMIHPTPCTKGFYCPAGSINHKPCPPGSYGNATELAAASECSTCDPGMYCKRAGNTAPVGLCKAGFWCLGGASSATPSDGVSGGICPSGSYCPPGSSIPKPCPIGRFSDQRGLENLSQCQLCLPGFYCAELGLSAVSGPCLPGFFCLEGSHSAAPMVGEVGGVCIPGHFCEGGTVTPVPCPVGTYRPEKGARSQGDCTACPPGWFQDEKGQTDCRPCLLGYYCPGSDQNGTVFPQLCPAGSFCGTETEAGGYSPCPVGTYSPSEGLSRADQCLPCPEGHFCGSAGLDWPSGRCAPGFLCLTAAQVPNPSDNATGTPCPPGYYCQEGVIAGLCSPGYHCPWGSNRPDQLFCPPGYFCPPGAQSPLPCSPGTFSLLEGRGQQEDCTLCPAGHICRGFTITTGLQFGGDPTSTCPPGHYCPPGTLEDTAIPCPPGTMRSQPGAANQGECQKCPAGMFCHQHGLTSPSGLCQAGYYCLPGATSPNLTGYVGTSTEPVRLCPAGHYCPSGTSPMPCPPGTYSNFLALKAPEECLNCPPGHFCDRPALAHISEAALCDAGYVCLAGSKTPSPSDGIQGYPCPSGFSCPVGSVQEVPCKPGTYSPAPGGVVCLLCPAGSMCNTSATRQPLLCPAGHYCPVGTDHPLLCPLGTIGLQSGAWDASVCVSCPPGLYCSAPGSSQPQGQCQQGFYCQGGATSPTPQGSEAFPLNGPCPPGHFCPSGTLFPMPCPTGSFQNFTGGSFPGCLPCPHGHYCSSEGQKNPSGPCAAGFYCPGGFSSISPHAFICPMDHYCPEGSILPLACPAGTYQPQTGTDACTPCRAGFYCTAESGLQRCPAHSYCPTGSTDPHSCPEGTFTLPELEGLQAERECLSCPPGRFCRAGRLQGFCAAGYICISGSANPTPFRPLPLNPKQCEQEAECAGLCPAGFYCSEGAESPQPCPAHTVSISPGAAGLQDCLACPPQFWCREGDATLHFCPPGHYCDGLPGTDVVQGLGPKECPTFTYRTTPGAGSKGDCHPCPPGYNCNSTGLVDYRGSACQPGFWCSGLGVPIHCPPGTLRPDPGAASEEECQTCTAGSYCPDPLHTGQPNIHSIPCRAGYHCPAGAAVETPCKAGFYCGPMTGEPIGCPAGFFCPEGTDTYSKPDQGCQFPYFCPPNSSHALLCDGGFMPLKHSGLRVSRVSSCTQCEAGTYRSAMSPAVSCLYCPTGYFCPPGCDNYKGYPCPVGYVCPVGSGSPIPCPPGTYGNDSKAKEPWECYPCPADTFNHVPAQKACFPCGSSSVSLPGATSCTCLGQNRAFQHSDSSCLCKTGFVFYNKLDRRRNDDDSFLDCQPEVHKRCSLEEVRHASTHSCVTPSDHQCDVACRVHGGSLHMELGICHCEHYVSVEEVCNISCVSNLPHLSASRNPDGQLLLKLGNKNKWHGQSWITKDILGPDPHASLTGKVHFLQFNNDGVFGWILTDPQMVDFFLSGHSEQYLIKTSRKAISAGPVYSNPLPRIPNPVACIPPQDVLLFSLKIDQMERKLSHFPVYQKDHLFSSNPTWDYGAFRHLRRLILNTHFNATWFAHVFTEPGTYVFQDNGMPDWETVVVVSESGSSCDPSKTVFQPSSPTQLVRHGVTKRPSLNLQPNWSIIEGVLVLLLLVTLVLTATAVFLGRKCRGLSPMAQNKPRWRSLGEPSMPLGHIRLADRPELLGCRGAGEGAEAEETIICSSEYKARRLELEEFNVKTLYDKLEDQTLHLTSQLAKHCKDTQEFYRNMCQQVEMLQDLLANMDHTKLQELKELHKLCRQTDVAEGQVKDPYLPLMSALLETLERLGHGLDGENWLQPNTLPADGNTHRSIQDMHRPLEESLTDTADFKQGCEAPLLLESDTLCEQMAEERLVPWALENLSARHLAVFLFGCDVVRQLHGIYGFPWFILLPAQSVPCMEGFLGRRHQDFHYDATNQILYICKAQLDDVGSFTSILLQAVAYITAGPSPQGFLQALHQAVSVLALTLFQCSFRKRQPKDEEKVTEASEDLYEMFLNVKIPLKPHFSDSLLADRLQRFKFFKLREYLWDSKSMQEHEEKAETSLPDTHTHLQSVEQEIDWLNRLFLQLSAKLVGYKEQQRDNDSPGQSPAKPASSQLLSLRRRCVAQRLRELHRKLDHSSAVLLPDQEAELHKSD